MSENFCPSCGQQRQPGAPYCSGCGVAFAGAPDLQQNVASGMLELEKLRAKLIPFRLGGIAVGLAIWFLVIGPMLGVDGALISLILLPVMVFAGLYLGNIAGLSVLRKS